MKIYVHVYVRGQNVFTVVNVLCIVLPTAVVGAKLEHSGKMTSKSFCFARLVFTVAAVCMYAIVQVHVY